MNRLREAHFAKVSIVGTSSFPGAYDEQLTYDRNGNILSLLRHTGDANENQIVMDNLSYTYQNGNNNSNQLLKVTDAVSGSSTGGFSNGSSGTNNDYAYDDNDFRVNDFEKVFYEETERSSMISDLNKGITEILYNHLNLPTLISFANGNSIEYLYNAAGIKIEKKVHDTANNTLKQVEYMDGFQYAGGILQFFPTSEGYVAATESNEIANPYLYNYVYNYTDHLGNIRLSYTKDPVSGELEIMEENHYYPFGLKHAVYSDIKQKYELDEEEEENLARPTYVYETEYQYKYQGQELQDELGLNWYSFKWRNYDYAIGRFFNHDPLSEKYTYNSTYAFQENKMGMGRELEGLELIERIKDKTQQIINEVDKTIEKGKEWIKENVVVEVEAKVTFGAQAGIKNGAAKVEAGFATTELGKTGLSTEKGAYAEKGDGKGHNFAGVNGKILNKKLSFGAKVDYVTNDVAPPDGSDLIEYYPNNGELEWGINLGPEGSIGPGVKGDYDFLSTDTTISTDSECNCIDLGVGIKAIFGLEVNLKIGIKD